MSAEARDFRPKWSINEINPSYRNSSTRQRGIGTFGVALPSFQAKQPASHPNDAIANYIRIYFMSNSLYDILEVSRIASPEAISESYKRLHANFSGESASGNEDATNRLIALREAYNTLANPEKRKVYDQRLAATEFQVEYEENQPRTSFFKVLIIVSILGTCGVVYSKYRASEEQARLQREETAAAVRLAELEAKKAKEEKEERWAAEQVEYQRQRAEAYERANREREYNYGKQVSQDIRRAEAQARWEKERMLRQQQDEERQKQYDAERQLAREKAYIRKIEAENARYPRY